MAGHTEPDQFQRAARLIAGSAYLVAFTGAGISAESGVPTFRGEDGIWQHHDPSVLEIGHYLRDPQACWPVIRELFYGAFARAEPNAAHRTLAWWERIGVLKALITQNIDDLHHRAGSLAPIEYHGACHSFVDTQTGERVPVTPALLAQTPPMSPEGSLYKPDFVFFGEAIPAAAAKAAEAAARMADVMIVVGTTGEVYPAASLPVTARNAGATIIEVNPNRSAYTDRVTDIWLQAPAGEAFTALQELVG